MSHVNKEYPRAGYIDLYVRKNVRDPPPRCLKFHHTSFGGGSAEIPWRGLEVVSTVQVPSIGLDEYLYTFNHPTNGSFINLRWLLECRVPQWSNNYHCNPRFICEFWSGGVLTGVSNSMYLNVTPWSTDWHNGWTMSLTVAPGITPAVFTGMVWIVFAASWSDQPAYKPLNWISDPGTENIYGDPI